MRPTLGPSQARLILELSGLPALRFEHTLTRRVIAAIPDEHAGYRPAEGVRTAGELARHLMGTELRFLGGVVAGTFSELGNAIEPPADLRSVLGAYERRFETLTGRLDLLPGEDLVRLLDYRGVVQMPALGFVQFALNHTIHHRGQLSVYLRAVGAALPPIYG